MERSIILCHNLFDDCPVGCMCVGVFDSIYINKKYYKFTLKNLEMSVTRLNALLYRVVHIMAEWGFVFVRISRKKAFPANVTR